MNNTQKELVRAEAMYELLDDMAEQVRRMVFENDLTKFPQGMIVRYIDFAIKDNELHVESIELDEMPDSLEDRQSYLYNIGYEWGDTRRRQMPVCIFAVTEVWLGNTEETELLPSEQPGRKEGLMVKGVSINGLHNAKIFAITRTPENVMTLKEYSSIRAVDQDSDVYDNLFEYFYNGFTIGYMDNH